MSAKSTNILLGAVVVLLTINLAVTTVVYLRQSASQVSSEQLAPEISRTWGNKVVQLYNLRDAEALYALFSPQARLKISLQQLTAELDKLHRLFGKIEGHAYVNSVKIGEKAGERYYQLFFNAQVSKVDTRATLILSLITGNDDISLYGMRLSAADSAE